MMVTFIALVTNVETSLIPDRDDSNTEINMTLGLCSVWIKLDVFSPSLARDYSSESWKACPLPFSCQNYLPWDWAHCEGRRPCFWSFELLYRALHSSGMGLEAALPPSMASRFSWCMHIGCMSYSPVEMALQIQHPKTLTLEWDGGMSPFYTPINFLTSSLFFLEPPVAFTWLLA